MINKQNFQFQKKRKIAHFLSKTIPMNIFPVQCTVLSRTKKPSCELGLKYQIVQKSYATSAFPHGIQQL